MAFCIALICRALLFHIPLTLKIYTSLMLGKLFYLMENKELFLARTYFWGILQPMEKLNYFLRPRSLRRISLPHCLTLRLGVRRQAAQESARAMRKAPQSSRLPKKPYALLDCMPLRGGLVQKGSLEGMFERPFYLSIHKFPGSALPLGHAHVYYIAPHIAALPFIASAPGRF